MKTKHIENMTLSEQIEHLHKVVSALFVRLRITEMKLLHIDQRMGDLLGRMVKE